MLPAITFHTIILVKVGQNVKGILNFFPDTFDVEMTTHTICYYYIGIIRPVFFLSI